MTEVTHFTASVSPNLTPEEYAALPHDNAGPTLLASVWTLGVIATVFLGLRVYCRLLRRQHLWWDDGILIGAWVCFIVEAALLTYMSTLGFGLHIWDFNPDNMAALAMPTNIAGTFVVTATVWSKTSFGITLIHITDGWIKKAAWFCIITMNIAMFVAALLPWISCTPLRKAWDTSVAGTCWHPNVIMYYHIFSSSYSALMDITLAFLPWKFIWNLQMKRNEKLGVGVALSMGVFAGITAVIKTVHLPLVTASNPADSIPLWIWGNAEVCSSIIAASIPMLRVLVREAQSSLQYPSGYYDKETGVSGNYSRFVTITSTRPPGAATTSDVELHKLGDDRSDRGILDNDSGKAPQVKAGIVQVTDITIKYDEEDRGTETEGERDSPTPGPRG